MGISVFIPLGLLYLCLAPWWNLGSLDAIPSLPSADALDQSTSIPEGFHGSNVPSEDSGGADSAHSSSAINTSSQPPELDIGTDGTGVKCSVYFVPSKVFVSQGVAGWSSVSHNGAPIWKAAEPKTKGKCFYCIAFMRGNEPVILHMHVQHDDRFKDLYFTRNKDKWKTFGTGFKKSVAKLMTNVSALGSHTMNLFSDTNRPECRIMQGTVSTIPVRLYIPQPGHRFTQLEFKKKHLWSSKDDLILLVKVYSRYPNQCLAMVRTNRRDFYILAVDDVAYLMSQTSFSMKIRSLLDDKLVVSTKVDISDHNEEEYSIFDCEIDDVDTRLFIPKLSFNKIVDGETVIWEAHTEFERCTYLKAHYRSVDSVMIYFIKEDNFGVTECAFGRFKGIKWVPMNYYHRDVQRLVMGTAFIDGFLLDLEDVEESQECYVFETELFGLCTTIFVPKSGFYTTRIAYGDVILHTCAQDRSERTKIIYVHRYSSSVEIIMAVLQDYEDAIEYYFMKEGDAFYSLGWERFMERLQKMKSKELQRHFCSLNLLYTDGTRYKVFEVPIDGISAKVLVPKEDTFANRIMDGKRIIWETTRGGERCLFSIVYLKEEDPALVYLLRKLPNKTEDVFLVKSSKKKLPDWKKWKSTNSYGKELEKLAADYKRASSMSITKFVLDLAGDSLKSSDSVSKSPRLSDDNNRYNLIVFSISGAKAFLYIPKPGYLANEVLFEKRSLWKDKRERCIYALVHCNDKEEQFISLLIRGSGSRVKNKRFVRSGNKWKSNRKYGSKVSNLIDDKLFDNLEERRMNPDL
ncbi:hypothetical protein BEWA_028380 [Theileria equi strain WA]|uniref:Signal peptide containing protein n=1 Tax=Theileria equi strain WA TaxID=1537102 RepID=L0AXL8_THEEQ|nr:hypothetical protein BEWA_028380 [Theileria equi strain WA]AFZ79988.1 hypothetical protein BEWA_028380 [Theileria equi strain WA]|eukprot:XP_004829654.1 hypothetical protein BEWA_028380 [Theileria equi strain WA]